MLLAAVVVYTLISITVAVATANKCDNVSNGHKDWSLGATQVGVQAGHRAR